MTNQTQPEQTKPTNEQPNQTNQPNQTRANQSQRRPAKMRPDYQIARLTTRRDWGILEWSPGILPEDFWVNFLKNL
jgi:hypothetical protein